MTIIAIAHYPLNYKRLRISSGSKQPCCLSKFYQLEPSNTVTAIKWPSPSLPATNPVFPHNKLQKFPNSPTNHTMPFQPKLSHSIIIISTAQTNTQDDKTLLIINFILGLRRGHDTQEKHVLSPWSHCTSDSYYNSDADSNSDYIPFSTPSPASRQLTALRALAAARAPPQRRIGTYGTVSIHSLPPQELPSRGLSCCCLIGRLNRWLVVAWCTITVLVLWGFRMWWLRSRKNDWHHCKLWVCWLLHSELRLNGVGS